MFTRWWCCALVSYVDVNTLMMLHSWLSYVDINTITMLRSWLSYVDIHTLIMLRLRSWLLMLMLTHWWCYALDFLMLMLTRWWCYPLDCYGLDFLLLTPSKSHGWTGSRETMQKLAARVPAHKVFGISSKGRIWKINENPQFLVVSGDGET